MSWDFDNEAMEKLVELVRNYPAVYDVNHPSYRDHQARTDIWNNIGSQLGKSGEVCKRKWTYVRDNYVKKRKEEARGWKSKRQRWWLADAMSFLDPFNQTRRREGEEVEWESYSEPEVSLVEEETEVTGGRRRPGNDPVGEFFQAMGSIVRGLPVPLQARLRRDIALLVTEAECSLYQCEPLPLPASSEPN